MQILSPALHRPNLSDDLATALRESIVDGQLAAGQRVNEVRVAASLGVSRTPLREALAALAAEGALTCIPRRGFFVRELTPDEARDIYPIRAILDPAALTQSGLPSQERLALLDRLNRALASSEEVERAIELDDAWHLELYADCTNAALMELIHQFMRRTRRYELASMRERRVVEKSTQSKAVISRELRAGRLDRACEELAASLRRGLEPVLAWLAAREPATLPKGG